MPKSKATGKLPKGSRLTRLYKEASELSYDIDRFHNLLAQRKSQLSLVQRLIRKVPNGR